MADVSFRTCSLPALIILPPLRIGRRCRRNNRSSFSPMHFGSETVLQLRTVGWCAYHRRVLQQSLPEICLPLSVPAEVGFQDVLRQSALERAFFFMVVPPSKFFNGEFPAFHFRRRTVCATRHLCRVAKKAEFCRAETRKWTRRQQVHPIKLLYWALEAHGIPPARSPAAAAPPIRARSTT